MMEMSDIRKKLGFSGDISIYYEARATLPCFYLTASTRWKKMGVVGGIFNVVGVQIPPQHVQTIYVRRFFKFYIFTSYVSRV